MDTTTAFEEGYKAYENYQHLSDNPYVNTTLNNGADMWECGFKSAAEDEELDRQHAGMWS
jgi:hypothetical protein